MEREREGEMERDERREIFDLGFLICDWGLALCH